MATLVKFKDMTDDSADTNFGILLDDGNIICMYCGGTVEKGDYEIVEKLNSDSWYYANQSLLAEFEL